MKKIGILKKLFPLVFFLLLIGTAAAAYYFWNQVAKFKENPQQLAQQEVREIVRRVSELMVLPEGEDPTVATVTDPERLKDQPFFEKAKKGDKVLIYTNAKRAILYDPVANKILEVAPVNIGAPQGEKPTSTPPTIESGT